LSLSGIVLERSTGSAALTVSLAGVVPARPTTARVFPTDEQVLAAMRVYQGGRRFAAIPVDASIVEEEGRVVFTQALVMEPATFGDQRHADYRLPLPLDRLSAGEYLLRVEASAGEMSARRDVRFFVQSTRFED
jgi:hypothetical protein